MNIEEDLIIILPTSAWYLINTINGHKLYLMVTNKCIPNFDIYSNHYCDIKNTKYTLL